MIQVLIDADNLPVPRITGLLRVIPWHESDVLAAGSPPALAAVAWPTPVRRIAIEGWQQADIVLASAYRREIAALVLASGDGDFAHLVAAHAGPVLVVSDRPAGALRAVAPVIDPVLDGLERLRSWFDAVVDGGLPLP